jgi:hypothetical protein
MQYLMTASGKVASNPHLLYEKVRSISSSGSPGRPATRPTAPPWAKPLGLQPGERVRVRPVHEIMETLDEGFRFEGLGYMPGVMDPYSGGVYTVYKRVDRFFDERNWKLCKLKGVVILESVYCDPPGTGPEEYAGCDRSCFLFWKEAWLEREPSESES